MSNFKFWGWDKKPRTMLRFVKPGDIFCFKLDNQRYCFGRIVAKLIVGHVAEFFNNISHSPDLSDSDVDNAHRLIEPIIIDTYSLFDKKIEKDSDWRIIGNQNNYTPKNMDEIYFTYGIGQWCKKVDIWGNETSISEKEAKSIPNLSPHGDYDIKQLLKNI